MLLIHGRVDGRADYEHARRMRAALEQNQKKVEWLALSDEGHAAYIEFHLNVIGCRYCQANLL